MVTDKCLGRDGIRKRKTPHGEKGGLGGPCELEPKPPKSDGRPNLAVGKRTRAGRLAAAAELPLPGNPVYRHHIPRLLPLHQRFRTTPPVRWRCRRSRPVSQGDAHVRWEAQRWEAQAPPEKPSSPTHAHNCEDGGARRCDAATPTPQHRTARRGPANRKAPQASSDEANFAARTVQTRDAAQIRGTRPPAATYQSPREGPAT